MDNQNVCNYCGNIYDASLERCPLCGSSSAKKDAKSDKQKKQTHAPRPRGAFEAPEPEKKPRRAPSAQPKQKKEGGSERLLKWSVVCLAAAVLIVGYTIGDFIGWWPGLEDLVDRTPETTLSGAQSGECSYLSLSVEGESLDLTAPGQTVELTVWVNVDCEEEIRVNVANGSLVLVEQENENASKSVELKSYVYRLTALAPGETFLTVTCGEKTETRRVLGEFEGTYTPSTTEPPTTEPPVESTTELSTEAPTEAPTESSKIPDDFEPILNLTDVTLTAQGEVFYAKVKNLPEGAEVVWKSKNEKIATVNENGKVTAVGAGTTTVTATVNGKSAELIVRCNFKTQTKEYHLNLTDVTIGVGESFTVKLFDSDGNRITEGLSFRVGNSEVISCTSGTVKGLKKGTTNVYVIYKGVEYKCIVRVNK